MSRSLLTKNYGVKVKDFCTSELFFILALVLFLLTQFNGCSQREDISLKPQYEKLSSDSDVLQARESGSIVQHSVLCSIHHDTVFVTHQDAYYQCCLEAKMFVHKSGSSLDIIEYDVGQPCDCMCTFDLTTAIVGLPSGSYTIKVWNENGEFYGECEATIEKGPRLANSSQTECLSYPKVTTSDVHNDSIRAVYQNDTLTVSHENAFYNCCFHISVEMIQNGPILNFVEHPAGEPCLCMCSFNIVSKMVGLAPGTYWVRVWNEDYSILFGEVAFTIPPDMTAKTVAENDDPSPSGLGWRYVFRQRGCKEYPKKRFQNK